MHLDRILNTEIGRNIVSIILGLGIASLFRKVCTEKNCLHFQGPIMEDIEGKIFKQEDKCFTYSTEHVACDDSKEIIDIATSNQFYEENRRPPAQIAAAQAATTTGAATSAAGSSSSSGSSGGAERGEPDYVGHSDSSLKSSWDFLEKWL